MSSNLELADNLVGKFQWIAEMFDSLSELIEKIGLGEDSTVEFKRQLPRRDSLADEIAAFANARGGVILIGVDDHGDIVGLDQHNLDQTEKTVVEICRDSVEKAPIYEQIDETLHLTIFAAKSLQEEQPL